MRHRWYWLGLALAVMFLLNAASANGALSFRNGVNRDTTPGQMLKAEGLSQSAYNRVENGGFTYFYLKGQDVYYVFSGEELLQAYTVLPLNAYEAELQRQTAAYGAPAEISADAVGTLLNILVPDTAMPGALSQLSGWRLADGTLAALFTLNGNTFMAYFNEASILSFQ